MYTGRIAFASLSSQDASSSENKVQDDCSQGKGQSKRIPLHDSEGLDIGPCSPKSVYCLTNEVCLALLMIDAIFNGLFT